MRKDESDESVWHGIASIRRAHEALPPGSTVPNALNIVSAELGRTSGGKFFSGLIRRIRTSVRHDVIHALRPPKSVKEALAKLQSTHVLDEKAAKRVENLGILLQAQDGSIMVRNLVLPAGKAMFLLSAISVLTGIYVGWIWFDAPGSLGLIMQSSGVGMVMGTAAGRVLDRSVRLWPIMEKIESAAPWLKQ
jgi:hypothetical protein